MNLLMKSTVRGLKIAGTKRIYVNNKTQRCIYLSFFDYSHSHSYANFVDLFLNRFQASSIKKDYLHV